MKGLRAGCALALAATLSGCGGGPGGGYYQDDGPDHKPAIDVTRVPDAVPRAEPLSAYGNKPYNVFGVAYQPLDTAHEYRERGVASWYGRKFHGRPTSNREPYDMYAMTAAHRTLPLPSYARVRNLENGRSVVVRVNDRGPFLHNRLIDLSYAAAARLDILGAGTGLVEVETITPSAPAPAFTLIAPTEAAERPDLPQLSVQAGAFALRQNAIHLRDRLERAGLVPVSIQSAAGGTSDEPALYRVRVGPLADVAEGDRVIEQMTRAGIADARLVVE